MSRHHAKLLLFWLTVTLALGWQLGSRGLNEPDEGRAAGIAREMQDQGSWVMPRLYDHAHLNKPPLLYWMLRVAYGAGGRNEWMARLPSALSALGILALTAALARRMIGPQAGLPAATLLLTAPLFFVLARLIDYNMLLTFCTTLAFWAFWAWLQDGRPHQRALFYAGLTLAFLAKGPVGPALVLAACAVYRWRPHPALPWRPIWHAPLGLAAVALSLGWYVSLAGRHPELWRFFVGDELVNRVFTTEHRRGGSFFFYFLMTPAAVLPWVVLLALALKNAPRAWRFNPGLRLVWSACALGFLLFTLARSKMPTYILPLLPLLAIATGAELQRRMEEGAWRVQLRTALLIGVAVCHAVVTLAAREHGWASYPSGSPLVALLLVAFLFLALLRESPGWSLAVTAAGLLGAFLLTHRVLVAHETQLGPHTTIRACAEALKQAWRPGDRVALLTRFPRGLAFYFPGPVSVPLEKFPLQLEGDRARVAAKDFADPLEIFRAFDATGRVFMVGSEELLAERRRDARRPVHVLYRDDRYVLISNEPASLGPAYHDEPEDFHQRHGDPDNEVWTQGRAVHE
jgi:4-amino-4-deoxy-L-arabinose transferase-like glycosyltransferase